MVHVNKNCGITMLHVQNTVAYSMIVDMIFNIYIYSMNNLEVFKPKAICVSAAGSRCCIDLQC